MQNLNKDICEKCGERAVAGVCQGCQEVVSCCDCPKEKIEKLKLVGPNELDYYLRLPHSDFLIDATELATKINKIIEKLNKEEK